MTGTSMGKFKFNAFDLFVAASLVELSATLKKENDDLSLFRDDVIEMFLREQIHLTFDVHERGFEQKFWFSIDSYFQLKRWNIIYQYLASDQSYDDNRDAGIRRAHEGPLKIFKDLPYEKGSIEGVREAYKYLRQSMTGV